MLIVEDEPFLAEAIRDGLRLEAIAADIAGDGDTALELLSVNGYDIAVLDRDIPGPSGDEVAERIVASGTGMPILMLTAADRLDDKASGFELGADDYLTKPFELRELVLRLRALDRRRAHHRPPVREIAGLRLDPVPPRGLPRRPLRRAHPQAVRRARGARRCRRRCRQRRRATGAGVGRERRPVHQRRTHHGLGAAQTARRTLAHRHRSRRRLPHRHEHRARGGDVDRAPGLSVRLKLTLSYAGFLMVAGALLLAVVWVFLLRYVPDGRRSAPAPFGPTRSDLLDAFVPKAARMLAFLLVFGLAGRVDPRRQHARAPDPHHQRHPPGRGRIALPPDPAGRPQGRVPRARRRLRHHARAARGARRRAAEVRGQRLPRAAHPAGDHADTSRRGPQGPGPRPRRAGRPPPHRQRPSDRPHRGAAAAQPRRPAVLHPGARRPVPRSRKRPPRRCSPSRRSAVSPSRPPATPHRPSGPQHSCCS